MYSFSEAGVSLYPDGRNDSIFCIWLQKGYFWLNQPVPLFSDPLALLTDLSQFWQISCRLKVSVGFVKFGNVEEGRNFSTASVRRRLAWAQPLLNIWNATAGAVLGLPWCWDKIHWAPENAVMVQQWDGNQVSSELLVTFSMVLLSPSCPGFVHFHSEIFRRMDSIHSHSLLWP